MMFQVAWVRVDTQTVLSFNEHVITKNHRIKVSTPEKTEWRLEISDIKRRDAGFYMCQINTDPMQSRLAYLEVLGELVYDLSRENNPTITNFLSSVCLSVSKTHQQLKIIHSTLISS